MSQELPIIDISSLTESPSSTYSAVRTASARELFTAFSEIGFAIITGHQVADETIQDMRVAIKAIFDTPRDVLARTTVEKINYRGFVPVGYFTPNSGKGKADQYEAWKLHSETPADDPICQASTLYGPNRWPEISVDVKTPIMAYWAEMDRVSQAMLQALCDMLGIDAAVMLESLDKPLTNMTLLNYPPTDPKSDQQGIHAHKDFDLLTILAHDPIGGLEVRNREGVWLNANCPADGMVVNVGDMLELWTGGRLLSTPHRVTNHSGRARQSFPYFVVPRFDVDIAPLLPPLDGFDRMPLNSGRASADIWYSNWPDEVSVEPGQELGNFEE